jgi:hypothetical protein
MRNKASIADYLYSLADKYNVDFETLFKTLIEAREKEEAQCGKLTVQCRKKAKKHDVFLITNDHKVVAQFFVPKYYLDQPSRNKELRFAHLIRESTKPDQSKTPKHINDLRCGMKRINVTAKVISVPKATLVFTRYGDYAKVTNALVGDETGNIKLCLWNEKINNITENSVIQIENASVSKFRGEKQIRLGKNAKLSVVNSTTNLLSSAAP